MVQVTQDVNLAPDQSYLGLSKAISPYEGDKSKGLALTGAANILEGAVTSADMLIKQKISMDVHSGVDARRDAELNALATLRESATGTPAAANPESKTYDLFNQNKPVYDGSTDGQPPAALQGISSLASNLKASLVGGHIPLTYYRQQMDSFAKDMRSMYGPGYRPYVDEQFKQAGAGDTANEYMQALVSDLNKLGSKAQSADERMNKRLEESNDKGVPGVPALIAGRKAGTFSDDYINQKLNLFNKEHYINETNKERYTAFENGTKVEAYNAEQDINKKAFSTAAIYFTSVLGAVGINSTEDLAKKAAEARANPSMYTGQQYESWAQMALAHKQTAYKAMWADVNKPFGDDNRSYVDRLGNGGAEKARQAINTQLGIFDDVYNAFKSKDFGVAMWHAQTAQRILEKAEHDALTDPDWGPYKRILATSNKQDGPAVAGIVMDRMLQSGALPKFQQYMQKELLRATTPGDNTDGSKKTLKDVLKEINTSATAVSDTELPKTFINHVTNLANSKLPDPAKIELVKWAFDPKNQGSLNQIAPDRYDEASKTTIKGQAWMFQTLTNKVNTAEIRRLDQANPGLGLWKNYKNWAEESFGFQQLSTELKTVNESVDQGVGMKWANGHITLDDRPSNQYMKRAGLRGGVNPGATAAVQRINDSLDNLKSIYAAENPDPKAIDAYLIRTLNTLGIDPNRTVISGPQLPPKEIVEKMWSAIASTAKDAAAATAEGAKKVGKTLGNPNPKLGHPIDENISHYVDEAIKGRTAQDFMRNPVPDSESADDAKARLQRQEAERTGTLNRNSTRAKWWEYQERNK